MSCSAHLFLPFSIGHKLYSRSRGSYDNITYNARVLVKSIDNRTFWNTYILKLGFLTNFNIWMGELLRVVEPSGHWASQTRSNFYPTICFNDQTNANAAQIKFFWKVSQEDILGNDKWMVKSRGQYHTHNVWNVTFEIKWYHNLLHWPSQFPNAVQIKFACK